MSAGDSVCLGFLKLGEDPMIVLPLLTKSKRWDRVVSWLCSGPHAVAEPSPGLVLSSEVTCIYSDTSAHKLHLSWGRRPRSRSLLDAEVFKWKQNSAKPFCWRTGLFPNKSVHELRYSCAQYWPKESSRDLGTWLFDFRLL